jgi:hypothetical protein
MSPSEFVTAIRIAVEDGAVRGVLAQLQHPSGRTPETQLWELHEWYSGLSEDDRQMLERAIIRASKQATYNFLLVLDGKRAIEDRPDKGSLRLLYEHSGKEVLINDPRGDDLTEIFKEVDAR